MKFCPSCHTLLESSTMNGVLKFKCPACEEADSIELTAHDTLIMKVRTNNIRYDKLYKDVPHLPCANLVEQSCSMCKSVVMALVYVGPELRPLYVCKCGFYKSWN